MENGWLIYDLVVLIESFKSLNFTYCNLSHENIELSNYLGWLRGTKANKYIESARIDISLEDIHKYIDEKNLSNQALLLGIFCSSELKHIGNIKFEPINKFQKFAWIGILIGESEYRGKGHSSEIFLETMQRVHDVFGIKRFLLGVDKRNKIAYRAYQKIGFANCGIHEKGGLIMEKFLT